MKAIQVLASSAKFTMAQVPLPRRLDHEILVKTKLVPIHPSDLQFDFKTFPYIPGCEGSGTIVEAKNQEIVGKRVAFYSQNSSWAEFVVPKNYLLLPDDVDDEHAALLNLNPIAALAIKKISLGQSFILSAANSALGKLVFRICNNQKLICIVRNGEARQEMVLMGSQYILDETRGSLEEYFRLMIKELKPSLGFDLVSGHMTRLLLNHIQPSGNLYIVGSLSKKEIHKLDYQEFTLKKKNLLSFSLDSFNPFIPEFYKEILLEPQIFYSKIRKVYDLKDFSQGITEYSRNMKGGKILIRFH